MFCRDGPSRVQAVLPTVGNSVGKAKAQSRLAFAPETHRHSLLSCRPALNEVQPESTACFVCC